MAMLLIHPYKRAVAVELTSKDSIDFLRTQQDIAGALDISFVYTNKTLRRLQKLDLFGLDKQRLALLDPRALQKLAGHFKISIKRRPLM